MNQSELQNLVCELTSLSSETEWVEFKHNNVNPEDIGENLSALSNAAALMGRPFAYIVWGVENEMHKIVGTTFRPRQAKKSGEELENWLLRLLDPQIDFRIHEGKIDGQHIVLFKVPSASNRPVRFKNVEYLRVGSYTKKLHDFPAKEQSLWQVFNQLPFEDGVAKEDIVPNDVLSLIDYQKYFQMTEQPLPQDNPEAILECLTSERIISPNDSGRYDISNLGAILFANRLKDFERMSRKALRIIIYKGKSKVETIKEQAGGKGYALGFEGVIHYINDQLPQNEQITEALRKKVRMYPEIAIRELVANALIHQDFNITGAGPTVEIFSDRMEITNPGVPLIDTLRFIDVPPRSRNETLAGLMRRMAICEERGGGIDRVISSVEAFQLPAPEFRAAEENTVAILYGPREFSQMNREERIRACYQHACLRYVSGERMSNASLRERFGLEDAQYTSASRIISDSTKAKFVRLHSGTRRDASYVPFWA